MLVAPALIERVHLPTPSQLAVGPDHISIGVYRKKKDCAPEYRGSICLSAYMQAYSPSLLGTRRVMLWFRLLRANERERQDPQA